MVRETTSFTLPQDLELKRAGSKMLTLVRWVIGIYLQFRPRLGYRSCLPASCHSSVVTYTGDKAKAMCRWAGSPITSLGEISSSRWLFLLHQGSRVAIYTPNKEFLRYSPNNTAKQKQIFTIPSSTWHLSKSWAGEWRILDWTQTPQPHPCPPLTDRTENAQGVVAQACNPSTQSLKQKDCGPLADCSVRTSLKHQKLKIKGWREGVEVLQQ